MARRAGRALKVRLIKMAARELEGLDKLIGFVRDRRVYFVSWNFGPYLKNEIELWEQFTLRQRSISPKLNADKNPLSP